VADDGLLVRLARRVTGGDRDALDPLLEELRPLVVRTARLIVGSGSAAAEDAAQEALLDITRGIGSLREAEAARAWAIRVATRRALTVARSERLISLRQAALAGCEPVAAPEYGRSDALKDAFDTLPPVLRATAVLRLYVGLSEAETARALDCPLGTVKSNLHDARRKLSAALAERGFTPSVAERRAGEEV
jgi:RNA polymerase sigma factor (sigma-70 family)